ncbi:MAG: hypothetical protein ABMA64_25160 [Myxococcota bacterium]
MSPREILGWVSIVGVTFVLSWVAIIVLGFGAPYYLSPGSAHPAHPLDTYYGSGRPIGLLLGIVGASLMVVLLMYSVRKWVPFLGFLGSSQFWMRFHLVCGLLGPAYILLHAELKPPSGFVAIGFWCMVLVALSGFFGRYLFGYFPQTAADMKLDLETSHRRIGELKAQLVAETRDAKGAKLSGAVALAGDLRFEPRTLGELMVLDADVRRRTELVKILLFRAGLPADVRKRAEKLLVAQLQLRRTMAGYDVARRLLRYWNLFHQPLALAMYLIMIVHILNAVIFGGSVKVLLGGLY